MKYLLEGTIVLFFLWFFLWSLGWISGPYLRDGVSMGLGEGCLDHFCGFWDRERREKLVPFDRSIER